MGISIIMGGMGGPTLTTTATAAARGSGSRPSSPAAPIGGSAITTASTPTKESLGRIGLTPISTAVLRSSSFRRPFHAMGMRPSKVLLERPFVSPAPFFRAGPRKAFAS
jgi:hypothetical protein